ncbi:MAG TPA: thiamine pyrophosphate-dependent enzyme [Thermoanaerobaculia bacterium]|nr:thiamine pyrophosphate-dependent enzyme [Thermoanaerobaculia bacterium]
MHHGPSSDWALELPERYFTLENYDGGVARWCPGCGDFAVLSAVQRICRDAQIPPERLAMVSGIGCSSRFPHYMHAYGFHGLHGRALPVACGVKSRRPDLHVWVATGDGDCCSIGAGHWLHAARYNMDMVVMVFDNSVYGLTKKQTSPTTPIGMATNTHPTGAFLPPLNVAETTLGFPNVSFVARTVDWNPVHLYQTLKTAYEHRGTSFVHILQRCPTYTPNVFDEFRTHPELTVLLTHEQGVPAEDAVKRMYVNHEEHDPADLAAGRALASMHDKLAIGLLYRNAQAPRYDQISVHGLGMSREQKIAALESALDRFSI